MSMDRDPVGEDTCAHGVSWDEPCESCDLEDELDDDADYDIEDADLDDEDLDDEDDDLDDMEDEY